MNLFSYAGDDRQFVCTASARLFALNCTLCAIILLFNSAANKYKQAQLHVHALLSAFGHE